VADGLSVQLALSALPPSGALNAARVIFRDNLNVLQTNDWSFTITYLALDTSSRSAGAGNARGFSVRVVQAPLDAGQLENSLQRAESQLAANSSFAKAYDITVVDPLINYSQNAPDAGDGFFAEDLVIPGASIDLGTDNYAMEVRTFLNLPAGIVRFGVNCDDGYKVAAGATPDASTLPLAFHNGGPANETFDVVVPAAGLYPFRLVWYERGGGAHVEWFSVDRTSGDRTLLNAPGGIQAFATITAPNLVLQSTANAGTAFVAEPTAAFNTTTKTITIARNGESRLYRLVGPAGLKLLTVSLNGETVTLTYQ
jgi:hypothetical protein